MDYKDFDSHEDYINWLDRQSTDLADNVNDPSLSPEGNAHALVYGSGWYDDYSDELKSDLYSKALLKL